MVDKLKAMTYPLHRLGFKIDCVRDSAAKRLLFEDAGNMKITTKGGNYQMLQENHKNLPLQNHHHTGQLGADGVTAVCTKPPFTTRKVANKRPREKYYSMGQNARANSHNTTPPLLYAGI